jgi:hypothetical protein
MVMVYGINGKTLTSVITTQRMTKIEAFRFAKRMRVVMDTQAKARSRFRYNS